MNCKKCNSTCIKNGFQLNGVQRFLCTSCKLGQQQSYRYNAYKPKIDQLIVNLLVNSSGIRDISRILIISKNTVISKILAIAKTITKPYTFETNQIYEVDELCTTVAGKKCWISYGINRKTKQVINFFVGSRKAVNLNKIIKSVLLLNPKRVYIDQLPWYKNLIPAVIHRTQKYQTNTIERHNLNLRTHLKRLSRKTICYSKNIKLLIACVKIYFWYNNSEKNKHCISLAL